MQLMQNQRNGKVSSHYLTHLTLSCTSYTFKVNQLILILTKKTALHTFLRQNLFELRELCNGFILMSLVVKG